MERVGQHGEETPPPPPPLLLLASQDSNLIQASRCMCIGATECLNTRVDKLGVFRHWGVPIAALLLVLSGYNYLQLSEFCNMSCSL
jgi:hypothetical protein